MPSNDSDELMRAAGVARSKPPVGCQGASTVFRIKLAETIGTSGVAKLTAEQRLQGN
jgi:hypothetical protein